MTFDEAQALEILIHDAYADMLEIVGIAQSGTGAYLVTCRDRADGAQMSFFHEDDLFSDFGKRIVPTNEPRAIIRDEDNLMSGFFVLANHELMRARAKHGPMHSHHEAYAVLLEELDEVWAEVKMQQANPQRIIAELIQVAAMCARWAEDVCDVIGALPPTDERGR